MLYGTADPQTQSAVRPKNFILLRINVLHIPPGEPTLCARLVAPGLTTFRKPVKKPPLPHSKTCSKGRCRGEGGARAKARQQVWQSAVEGREKTRWKCGCKQR